MKLRAEIIRFSFLMEETLQKKPIDDWLTLAELASQAQSQLDQVLESIDFVHQSCQVNPRLFARAVADLANYCLAMAENVNQLPQVRHGLIDAMNDHLT